MMHRSTAALLVYIEMEQGLNPSAALSPGSPTALWVNYLTMNLCKSP